jgi:hypothetical protein
VTTTNYDSSFGIFFHINSKASWASVHIHYIVTSRNDIRVGQFIAPSKELQSTSNNSIYKNESLLLTYNFSKRKWNGGTPYAFLYAYISGVTCHDRFMEIKISSAYVQILQSNIYVGLTASSKAKI